MVILITIVSILFFSLSAFTTRKYLGLKICPICAGVSLTWLWMFLGMWYGLISIEKYQLITAVLMGGSIIGITNKLQENKEKFFRFVNNKEQGENVEKLKDKLKNCC